MKLYGYFRSSAAYRVRIALGLKGLAYEYLAVHLRKGEQSGESYRSLNPAQLVPALVDDRGTLTQSLAIIEYLDERHPHPPLLPGPPEARARIRAIALSIACDIHPLDNLRVLKYLVKTLAASEEAKDAWYRHWIDVGLSALEEHLSRDRVTGEFCHGDAPTMADLCLVSHCAGYLIFKGTLDRHPTVRRIYERCMGDEHFASAHPLRQPGAPKGH